MHDEEAKAEAVMMNAYSGAIQPHSLGLTAADF
jgi:hypothetical protein